MACTLLLWPGSLARADGPYAPVGADLLLGARPDQGLLVLHSGYANSEIVDADAMVFMGANTDGTEGDVLTVSIGLREPSGWGQARLGRFLLSSGAVRPVHIDGASALGRTPSGSTLELFGGLPVVAELGPRRFDWLAGGRAGQWLWQERFGLGVSYLHARDGGQLADEEVGADLTASPLAWLSLQALASYDLASHGLSETRASASAFEGGSQLQLFASRRVAARLLPATSLFSVVSDAPSSELGTDVLWNAFPRLDLGATVALEALGGELGYRGAARATLRLSDEAPGEIEAEGTRRKLGADGYTGLSLGTRVPILRGLLANASLELVAADHPEQRGALWPWSRIGASYALSEHWSAALALGARASPEHAGELQGLLRVGYTERARP